MDRIKKNIVAIKSYFLKKKIIRNVFSTKFDKRILIIYLTNAFNQQLNLRHSNTMECQTFAEIFNELGYNVDVINLNSILNIKEDYDIILGMGRAFENTFKTKTKKSKHIFYATGCNPIYSNMISTKKIRSFYKNTGIFFTESSRKIEYSQDFQIFLSDLVIVLGNQFVKNTYLQYDEDKSRYKNLDAFYFDIVKPNLDIKDITQTRKNFIWFGSLGALHKGLDLAIEYFRHNEEYTLHICGLNDSEYRLKNYYKKQLIGNKNIIFYGFVNINSPEFIHVTQQSSFAIFPSISEGGSPALLNVIANGGLIPIYSEQSGVDFGKNMSFQLRNLTIEAIQETMDRINKISDFSIKEMSVEIVSYVRSHYTYEKYKDNLREIINDFLKQ